MVMKALPSNVMQKLFCIECGFHLSIDPVKILSENASVCGRCAGIGDGVRNFAFEAVASHFLFPCQRVDDCGVYMPRDELARHEDECIRKSRRCCARCRLLCTPAVRHRKIEPQSDYIEASAALHDHLTCMNCYAYLTTPPLYITPKGLNICHRCGLALNQGQWLRNVHLELVLAHFVVRCSNTKFGCTVKLPFGADIDQHERRCDYRNGSMPINSSHAQQQQQEQQVQRRGVVETFAGGHVYATIAPQRNVMRDIQRELEDDIKRRFHHEYRQQPIIQGPYDNNAFYYDDDEVMMRQNQQQQQPDVHGVMSAVTIDNNAFYYDDEQQQQEQVQEEYARPASSKQNTHMLHGKTLARNYSQVIKQLSNKNHTTTNNDDVDEKVNDFQAAANNNNNNNRYVHKQQQQQQRRHHNHGLNVRELEAMHAQNNQF